MRWEVSVPIMGHVDYFGGVEKLLLTKINLRFLNSGAWDKDDKSVLE